MTEAEIQDGKGLATVAYITIFGALISIIMNLEKKNQFTAFHARQGLGLCLSFMAMGWVISQMDSMMISIGFWIFFGILFIYGIIGAISGKMNLVPFLGPYFQNWFNKVGR